MLNNHLSCQRSCKVGDIITVYTCGKGSNILSSTITKYTRDFKVVEVAEYIDNSIIPKGTYPLILPEYYVEPVHLIWVKIAKIKKLNAI